MSAFRLPSEGAVPSLAGATAWLNSEPLTPEALRGRVALFDFCTYTCINWLRTLPYVRAWADKYGSQGLLVVGVHTPEFPFEHDLDNIRPALAGRHIDHPVAVDNDYAVWQAFDNHYWPALYLADVDGEIRYHHFGEGRYEESERAIQRLLREAGSEGVDDGVVSVEPVGDEVSAVWEDVRTPETYLGFESADTFASPEGVTFGASRSYALPGQLTLNQWALAGEWTMTSGTVELDAPGGRVAFRFQARDVNLVMAPVEPGLSVGFHVTLDGQQPGASHGVDTNEAGEGRLREPRLYQLVRRQGPIDEAMFEIAFEARGASAYCFTFG